MTRLAPQQRIEVPDGVLMRELQGESVLLNLDSECYFGLDEIGTRMWAVLTTTPDVGAAMEALLAEFEVDAERLHGDLADFVESLSSAGLIRVVPA
ncbi:MAG TPA: PqqD family protein [Usitatibacter sp.]|nr:PqqD family protein [Usitatibacter sp.]